MTVKRNALQPVGTPNSSVQNLLEPKVIKSYENKPKAEPHVGEVSFAKAGKEPVAETATTTETAAPATETVKNETTEEKSAADKRAERREAYKETDKAYQRAIQMQKEAQAKLDRVAAFEKLVQSVDADPRELAKALGKDPTEFLRKYQNATFGIKEEESPPDPIKQAQEQYAKEREADRQQLSQLQYQITKTNYIRDKILPELDKDPDKYELITKRNKDGNASLIYDIMNEHYQKYGEELTAAEVAEEMEAGLLRESEAQIKNAKEFKKLANYFKVDEATVAAIAEQVQKTEPEQLSSEKPKTISNALGSGAPASVVTNSAKSYGHTRQDRLKRVLDKFSK